MPKVRRVDFIESTWYTTCMRNYELTYTNILDYSKQRTRVIRAVDEEEARIWFDNHLDRDNLLDWITEVDEEVEVSVYG